MHYKEDKNEYLKDQKLIGCQKYTIFIFTVHFDCFRH